MKRQSKRKTVARKKSAESVSIDWRSAAFEALPELDSLSEEIGSPMMLWIEIRSIFQSAYLAQPRNEDLIRRIYQFAGWCEDQEQPSDTSAETHFITCIAVAFFEHIPEMAESRLDMPRWFSKARVQSMRGIFGYHLSESEFEDLLKLFPAPSKSDKKRYC